MSLRDPDIGEWEPQGHACERQKVGEEPARAASILSHSSMAVTCW